MKQKNNNLYKSISFTLASALVVGLCQFLGAQLPSVSAATSTKDYSIGPGGAEPVSISRTFAAPAGVPVSAKVTYKRAGNTDISITVEIENPDGGISATKNVTASGIEQTVTLNASASNKGCAPPWKVRVKSANGQTPPAK